MDDGFERRYVKTSHATTFDDGAGPYLVMGVDTRRTFCETENDAIEHADNLIQVGNSEGFLILRVVGRLQATKGRIPTVFEEVD